MTHAYNPGPNTNTCLLNQCVGTRGRFLHHPTNTTWRLVPSMVAFHSASDMACHVLAEIGIFRSFEKKDTNCSAGGISGTIHIWSPATATFLELFWHSFFWHNFGCSVLCTGMAVTPCAPFIHGGQAANHSTVLTLPFSVDRQPYKAAHAGLSLGLLARSGHIWPPMLLVRTLLLDELHRSFVPGNLICMHHALPSAVLNRHPLVW